MQQELPEPEVTSGKLRYKPSSATAQRRKGDSLQGKRVAVASLCPELRAREAVSPALGTTPGQVGSKVAGPGYGLQEGREDSALLQLLWPLPWPCPCCWDPVSESWSLKETLWW